MTWDEKAQRAAEALDMETLEAAEPGEVRCGFREGARWQREALLADGAVERAARPARSRRSSPGCGPSPTGRSLSRPADPLTPAHTSLCGRGFALLPRLGYS